MDQHDQLYNTPKPQASSLSSPLSSNFITYPIQDQAGFYHQEATNLASQGGRSNDHQAQESERDHSLKLKSSLWKEEYVSQENQSYHQNGSIDWMPTKKRLILKMMKSDSNRPGRDKTPTNAPPIMFEDQKNLRANSSSSLESTENGSNNFSSSNPIRVCSDCNTTKTPLWRTGPQGPKSLCNACGIRQRKARRAMAAAAAAANGTSALEAPTKTNVQHKDKSPNISNGHITKYKKRSKIANTSLGKKKKVCFEEFLMSLSKKMAFQRVFPQDEKEAAILLMALSCGLVHG